MHPGGFQASEPFELIVIDTVGKLPYSDGFVKLLTVVDVFSKLAMAIPIANERSETVGRMLQQRFFSVHGYPRIILSDRAKGFVGEGLKWVCKHIGVAKIHTTGLLPTGASPVERWHRSLNASLTMLCNRAKNDWASQVDAVTFAYNISVNESTGFSPFYLTTGRHPQIPLSVLTGLRQASVSHKKHGFVEQMTKSLNEAYQFVRQRQLKTLERNTRVQLGLRSGATDKDVAAALAKRPIPGFSKGELVSYWVPEIADKNIKHVMPRKLQYRWDGPHEIVSRSGNHYYIARNGTSILASAGRLRKYHQWHEDTVEQIVEGEQISVEVREPTVGDLVITPLRMRVDMSRPFAVGQILAQRPQGAFLVRWYGNELNDMGGTYRPAWRIQDSSGKSKTFYSDTNEGQVQATPCTSDLTQQTVLRKHIGIWGFRLQFDDRLDHETQVKIHKSDQIQWKL
jgi:transposase InsO family protein